MAEALTTARTLWEDDPEAFEWQSFDGIRQLDGITVMDDAGNHLVSWTNPEARKTLAATALLYAAELAEDALSDLARLDDGTCSISALHALRTAIREAGG